MSDASTPDRLDTAIQESWAGRAGSVVLTAALSAWPSSRMRRVATPLAETFTHLSREQRIRAAAVAIAVAMVVERAMTLVMRRPADPMSAILPVAVLVTSVLVGACAGPLARLWGRLHR